MKKIPFNSGWLFWKDSSTEKQVVTLPHDAMIHEMRTPDAVGGSAHGFFPGGMYIYEKAFVTPSEWEEQHVLFHFEGIYRHSSIKINGKAVGDHPYGYIPFDVCGDGILNYGGENTLTVIADNSQLPNSRWYTGSGIYRPVSVIVGKPDHITWQGVRVTTLSCQPARIQVDTKIEGNGEVVVEIFNSVGEMVADGTGTSLVLTIPNAKLWSDETPELYTAHVILNKGGVVADEVTESFGIRLIEWSPKGLFINGRETLLRGGCFHHDNGILGAATYAESEERRVRIMKENGFNALRSSHNPTSDALIAACDKYGMYLIDETFDMWYMRKSKYDYGQDFEQWWQTDTTAMVERDYNHPSVIMYSIGNEVSEPAQSKGVEQTKAFVDLIHSLDATRPVTGGFNLMILTNAAKGKGVYKDPDKDAEKKGSAKSAEQKESNASLMFNIIASFTGTSMNNSGNSDKADRVTSPALDALDICGYNYGSGRYPLEGSKHPNRIVFGSETFPQDIYKNWQMVKQYPYLIGDFMWIAWDYLGETGLGAWSYTGGMPFGRPYPWLLAGAGVIDITGTPDASCRYAQTVWGLTDKPIIGVRPVNHPGVRVSKSVWRGTNAIESWSWQGCDGNKAIVEVYANAATAELYINRTLVGKQKLKECKAIFKTRYRTGTVTAVALDETGNEISRSELHSATGALRLTVTPEANTTKVGGIVYIPVSLQDPNGVVESNADCLLTASVTGGTLLGFGSANPCTRERYDAGSFTAYQGRALAVVRAEQPGEIVLTVTDGKQTSTAVISAAE